jgi:hypothetical protein
VLFKGQTTVSDALCRFQNANDAPLPDAQNVTEGRKSCEVPSFPQDTLLVFAVEWRFAAKFEAYAGFMFSQVNNGLANGYLNRNTIDPTVGLIFRF